MAPGDRATTRRAIHRLLLVLAKSAADTRCINSPLSCSHMQEHECCRAGPCERAR